MSNTTTESDVQRDTRATHHTAATQFVDVGRLRLAHRRFGAPGATPLVMLQHFRGNIDNWDPALTDALAAQREVILVDYPGAGASSGEFGPTIVEPQAADRDAPTDDALRDGQYDAIVEWGIPDHAALQRLTGIDRPTLVIQGDGDLMIPTKLSHLMAGLISDAQILIYPDSAHGFLFQHPARVAADVDAFLSASAT